MKTLIVNGRVIDPSGKIDGMLDIFIDSGVVSEISPSLPAYSGKKDINVIDAAGLIVAPGLVDMHCHLREPGFEYKEDISSGSKAACAGGFTSVACMPNTRPVADSAQVIGFILKKARETALINVFPIGAVSISQQGKKLSDFKALKAAGAVAVSDDGLPVSDEHLMTLALAEAYSNGLAIVSHCEDFALLSGGVINDGEVSRALNLPGIKACVEENMVERDLRLSYESGLPVHIAHVSTKGSVELVRRYKKMGARVTCETCPHYMLLDEREVYKRGTLAKMNPPLRTEADVKAVIDGLTDGTIDAIATDHAPHSADEKALPLTKAPNGVIGFETALSASLTALYHTGRLSLSDVLGKLTCAPAKILGIKKGTLAVGSDADIVIFSPDESRVITEESFYSKSANSCFIGMSLKGAVKYTILSGRTVFKNGWLT